MVLVVDPIAAISCKAERVSCCRSWLNASWSSLSLTCCRALLSTGVSSSNVFVAEGVGILLGLCSGVLDGTGTGGTSDELSIIGDPSGLSNVSTGVDIMKCWKQYQFNSQ